MPRTSTFLFAFLLACGASEPSEPASPEPSATPATAPATAPAAAAASEPSWTQQRAEAQPDLPALHTERSPHFTSTVASSSHLLIVRVQEFGTLEELTSEGDRRYYDYAWLEVVNPLYGSMSDVIAPYATRFPVFHMTAMQAADGSHGEAVPAAVSELRGRTGQEVIFIGRLPTQSASQSGDVPAPLASDGYDAYIVDMREVAGTDQVQDVMAVVGPQ